MDYSKSDISYPNFFEDDFPLEWHMSRNERYAMIALLEKIKPSVSIEIGCYEGGSLQALSKYSDKVYSVDINPEIPKKLESKFDNVEFYIGDSSQEIKKILKKIDEDGENLEFILIDGDHTSKGVKKDIESFLDYKPKKPIYIIFHDSFNPVCRKGIKSADYSKSPYVHFVDLDFISGIFTPSSKLKRQMWGGLALVVLLPEENPNPVKVHQSQKSLFNTLYWASVHPVLDRLKPILKKIIKRN